MRAIQIISIMLSVACVLPRAQSAETLLRNGLIHTQTHQGTIKSGSVLVKDGRVVAVGSDITASAGATVVDLNGRHVTPALFGGCAALGVSEITAEPTGTDAVLTTSQIRPEFNPVLAFDSASVSLDINRAEGIGFAVLVPDSDVSFPKLTPGSIATGLASVVSLDGRTSLSPPLLNLILGQDAAQLAGGSRAGAYMLLSQAFDEALEPHSVTPLDARLLTPAGRRVLREFVAQHRKVLLQVDRAADIRVGVTFAKARGLDPIVRGGAEAWRVAAFLARERVPVILDPFDDLPRAFDQLGATLENAAKLRLAGVIIGFSLRSPDPHYMRRLRQGAGVAVAHGLAWEDALDALTSAPAKIFGTEKQFGRIAPGLPATLVVWSGDPLEVTSRVDAMWLAGKPQSLRTRQTLLFERYLAKIRSGTAR